MQNNKERKRYWSVCQNYLADTPVEPIGKNPKRKTRDHFSTEREKRGLIYTSLTSWHKTGRGRGVSIVAYAPLLIKWLKQEANN